MLFIITAPIFSSGMNAAYALETPVDPPCATNFVPRKFSMIPHPYPYPSLPYGPGVLSTCIFCISSMSSGFRSSVSLYFPLFMDAII